MPTYGDVTGVEALVPGWNGTSNPAPDDVEGFLAAGYARINRALGSAGYVTPATSRMAVFPELTMLENLYAAAYVLRAQSIDTASGQGEERSEVWLQDFYSQLKDLVSSDLSLMGLSLVSTGTTTRRKRLRTVQMRRIDGYSGNPPRTVNTDMDFAQWVEQISQGEYTSPTMPTE